MSYDLIVKPEAEDDLSDAALWYEDRRKGLGNDFLMAVEAKLEAIKRNPEQFPFKYKTIKRAFMKRFPYVIYFLVEESSIFILAVIHKKRNPKYHQSRTEEF